MKRVQAHLKYKLYFFTILHDVLEGSFIEATLSVTHINGSEAEYFEELSDPDSPEFKEMEENVCTPVISGYP